MTPETAAVLAWARESGTFLSAFVVDVGCADGVTESNSHDLIEMGWSALLVDADPAAVSLARHRWRSCRRVEVVPAAVAGRCGPDVLCRRTDFTVSHLKSAAGVPARTVAEVPVETVTLSRLVGVAPQIGLLSLDLEGADTDVLAEFLAAHPCKPTAIVCEGNTERERARQDAIARAYGYRRLALIRPNGVYVREGGA